jgi:hypothetical protein
METGQWRLGNGDRCDVEPCSPAQIRRGWKRRALQANPPTSRPRRMATAGETDLTGIGTIGRRVTLLEPGRIPKIDVVLSPAHHPVGGQEQR